MIDKAQLKKAKSILKEIISICYDIDFEELQQEVASLERGFKDDLNSMAKASDMISQIEMNINIFSDDIDTEEYLKIEELIIEFTEME